VVDLYHARQHLWELVPSLHSHTETKQKTTWVRTHQQRLLDEGKIENLVDALRSIKCDNPEVAEKIRTEAE
jgi:hypothetical protein